MFNETDWSQGNRQLFQYKWYEHIYINLLNIVQLELDSEWIIAGDEALNNDIFTCKNVSLAFKNNVKVTVNPNLSIPVYISKLTHV